MLQEFNVGGRILKTAVAVTIAVFVAQHLVGYKEVNLAAIVALFTVQKTFYLSLMQSIGKVGSVLLGALIGTGLAVLLGNHALTFGLVTLIVILLCLKFNIQSQITITFVIAVFMIMPQADSFQIYIIFDQVSLALIGSLSALGVNYFFTPDHKQEIKEKVKRIDEELREKLEELSEKIIHPTYELESDFLDELSALRSEASEGLQLAKSFREEQRFQFSEDTLSDIYRTQFRTFKSFIDYMEEIYRLTVRMTSEVPQSIQIAKLTKVLKRMQKNAINNRKNPYEVVDKTIKNLEREYEKMELPTTREEFENRASLYHIFKELKRYYRRIKELPSLKRSTF